MQIPLHVLQIWKSVLIIKGESVSSSNMFWLKAFFYIRIEEKNLNSIVFLQEDIL